MATSKHNIPEQFQSPIGWGSEEFPRNVGDVVEGEITDLQRIVSNYGEYVLLTIILDKQCGPMHPGTRVGVHCFHAALASTIQRLKPRVGESIGICYLGQTESKRGQEYHDYRVSMSRGSDDFWDTPATPQSSDTTYTQDDLPF
jgi:hypothetical protein